MSIANLRAFLCTLEAVEFQSAGPIRIEFLHVATGPAERGLTYRTLGEALASGEVVLTEKPGGGTVGNIRLSNRAAERVLLVGGEVVRGGRQDRMVNTDVLVEAGSEIDLPVSCVERGRWSYVSPGFRGATYGTPSLRSALYRSVSGSYLRRGAPTSDQRAIWSVVDGAGQALRSVSPTSSLPDHYQTRNEDIRRLASETHCPVGACGMVVRLGDRWRAVDLFDRADTFGKYFPLLMEGYSAEALALPNQTVQVDPSATDLATILEGIDAREHPGVGLGSEVRLASARAHGGALVVSDIPVHLSLVVEA